MGETKIEKEVREMVSSMDEAMMASQKLTEAEVVHTMLVEWEGFENLKRLMAFKAILGERDYQDKLHKDTNQEPLSVPGELALLKIYLDKAFVIYGDTFGDPKELPTMDVIRKIATIAFRCMENHGSVERKK